MESETIISLAIFERVNSIQGVVYGYACKGVGEYNAIYHHKVEGKGQVYSQEPIDTGLH